VLLSGAVAFDLTMAVRAYLRYRGKRVIACPETANHAAVHVNVLNAAREAVFGKHDIRLDQCSCWPERQNCGQECLSQIEADPEGCMVCHMVDDWYKGKSCAYCQKPCGEIHWHDRQPALLGRTATPRSGARFRRKIGPLFFKTSFRCAGVASSRKTTGVSVPNSSWMADGNVAWVASMFRRNQRRMFRRNQSAATETALKLVLTGSPFKLATPHPSLGICEAPAETANARNEESIPHKHPTLVPLRSQ
jgi:hypothetical protein